MAQRRYTQQELDVLSSGEQAPPDENWYSSWAKPYLPKSVYDVAHWVEEKDRNVRAGIVNVIPQIAETPHALYSLGSAGVDWATGSRPFTESLASNFAGGDEAVRKTNDFVQQRVDELLAGRPEHERNDPATRAAIVGSVQGSKELHDYKQKLLAESGYLGSLSSLGTSGENAVNSYYQVSPTYQQDIGDETTQFISGALVPTPTKITKVVSKMPGVIRWAGHLLTPGSAGKLDAAVQAAVPTALDWGLRTATGAPTYSSPTAEDISSAHTEPISQRRYMSTADDAQPAAPPTDTAAAPTAPASSPMMEDANAPSPFAFISPAAASEAPGWQAPFQYGKQRPSPTSTATAAAPSAVTTSDPQQGGGGSTIGKYLVAGGAALALVAATLRGKIAPGLVKQIIDDVDTPGAALRMQPTVKDVNLVSGFTEAPTSTRKFPKQRERGRKISAGFAKDKAATYVAARARVNDPTVEQQVAELTRLNSEASPLEVANAHARTVKFGEMPLLNRYTVPLDTLRQRAISELSPQEMEQLHAAAHYADRVGAYDFSTQSLQDKIAQLHLDLSGATTTRARAAITRKLTAAQQEMAMRFRSGATLDDSTSVQQARQIVAAGMNNPKVARYVNDLRKIVRDADESLMREGLMSQSYFQKRLRDNPNFLPSLQDPHAGKGWFEKSRARLLESFKGRHEYGEGGSTYGRTMYDGRRGPTRGYGKERARSIKDMQNPFDAVDDYLYDMNRAIRHNRSSRSFVNMVMGTNDWGHTVKRVADPVSVQDFEHGKLKFDAQNALKDDHVILVNDRGMIHFIRTTDMQVARALRHNPSAVMSGMNAVRRLLEMTYTSSVLAPWFAWRGMRNELGVIRALQPAGTTAGYVQRALKDAFPNSAAWERVATFLPDPTFNLKMLSAVGMGMRGRAIKRVADFLSQQLMQNSTMVKMLGEPHVRAMAEAMIRQYNDTAQAVMTRMGMIDNMKTMRQQASIIAEIEPLRNLWKAANAATMGVPQTTASLIKNVVGLYIDFADSIRNAPRIAFHAENLQGLLKKYNGNIPQAEIKKLNRTTQYLSGDITRAIGNKGLATTLSISPYGVNSVNSTLHILEGMAHGGTFVTARAMANMVLPKVMWTVALSMLIGSQFDDEWWDNIPLWQRQSNIPMLSPTYFAEWLKGNVRKPNMNDVIFMPQEPEAILFAETVMTGLQAAGLFHAHAKDAATGMDILSALGTIVNVNIPVVDMYNAITGNSDKSKYERETLTGPSDTQQRIIDMIHAVVGGAADVIGNAATAGNESVHRGKGVADYMANVWGYGRQALEQKLSETPLSPLWGGQRRHYTLTQVRERNKSKFDDIRAVDEMLSGMKKAGPPGTLRPPMINDPIALRIAQALHYTANSGTMKILKSRRSLLYRQLDILDANRAKLASSEYTRRTEKIKHLITGIDRLEEQKFDQLNTQLEKVGGIDGGIAYIKQHIAP
jgi:hypothetical protein